MTKEQNIEFEKLRGMYHSPKTSCLEKEELLKSMRAILKTANGGNDHFTLSSAKNAELSISECPINSLYEIWGKMRAQGPSLRMSEVAEYQREEAWRRNEYSPDRPYRG